MCSQCNSVKGGGLKKKKVTKLCAVVFSGIPGLCCLYFKVCVVFGKLCMVDIQFLFTFG